MWVLPAPVSSAMMMFRFKLSSSISCWYPRVERIGIGDGTPSHGLASTSSGILCQNQFGGVVRRGVI
jgi:hypothetical protein